MSAEAKFANLATPTLNTDKASVTLPPAHTPKSDYPPYSGYTPLTGRANQIRLLDQQNLEVSKKSFCITLLSGEPGSGKTELVKHYFNRHRLPDTLLIAIPVDRENYQTDQFIHSLISAVLDQLSYRSGESANRLLSKIMLMLHREKMEWLVEQDSQGSDKGWPRNIIRRDAFLAHLKRIMIECTQAISQSNFKLLCVVKNIELLEFNCLDFIADAFRTQALPSFHLLAHSPPSRHKSLDFFLRDLFAHSSRNRDSNLFYNIHLPALSQAEIQKVIEQHLDLTTFDTAALTRYIYDKSKGNPGKTIFILELLKELKLIYFSSEAGSWCAQLERIKREKVLENHQHKTTQILERSYCSKKILIYAACYHHPFSEQILQAIMPTGLWPQVNNTIKLGLKYGILDYDPELADHYTFKTESIAKAILKLENANSLNIIYRKILNTTLSYYPNKSPFNERISLHQLADCINELLPIAVRYNSKTVYQKVVINALAGYRAYVRNNITQAYRYLNNAIELIEPSFFDQYHSLSFFCIFHWLRCLYLREAYDKCIEKCVEFDKMPLTQIEKAQLVIVKVYCYKATANHREAINTAITTMREFGVRVPSKVGMTSCVYQFIISSFYFITNPYISGKRPFDSQGIPARWRKMSSYEAKERVRIIHKLAEMVAQSGYFEEIDFAYYYSLKLIQLSHSMGITPHSSLGIQYYTFVLFMLFNRTALLNHNYQNRTHIENHSSNNQIINEMFYWGMYAPWRKPLTECINNLLSTYQSYNHTSDDESAGHCSSFCLSFSLMQGYDFKTVLEQYTLVAPELEAPKYSSAHYCNLIMAQATLNIVEPEYRSAKSDPTELRGKWFDETLHGDIIRNGDFLGKFCYHTARAYLNLVFDRWAQGEKHYRLTRPLVKNIHGLYTVAALRFVGEMNAIGNLHSKPSLLQLVLYLPRLTRSVLYFKRAARHQEENFGCFYFLLRGFFRSAIFPNKAAAIADINRGIRLAIKGRYFNFAALGSELKYKFIYAKYRPERTQPLKRAIALYKSNHNNAKRIELESLVRHLEYSEIDTWNHPLTT